MKDGIFLYSSCGSPNYAAPELINGKFYNGASIDIWSCGVILYTLLTGCLPFNEKQTNKLYKKITECKYILPDNISDSAKDLIFRILQKNPLDRITIPEIKQHKWFSNKLCCFISGIVILSKGFFCKILKIKSLAESEIFPGKIYLHSVIFLYNLFVCFSLKGKHPVNKVYKITPQLQISIDAPL